MRPPTAKQKKSLCNYENFTDSIESQEEEL